MYFSLLLITNSPYLLPQPNATWTAMFPKLLFGICTLWKHDQDLAEIYILANGWFPLIIVVSAVQICRHNKRYNSSNRPEIQSWSMLRTVAARVLQDLLPIIFSSSTSPHVDKYPKKSDYMNDHVGSFSVYIRKTFW